MAEIIYIFGLIVVAAYIIAGLDDLILDIIYVFIRKNYPEDTLSLDVLNKVPAKMLAITVAAWQEADVIEDVIENMVKSYHYPKAMYHIFIGVYPNDAETIARVTNLENKYSNIHMIVNKKDGPTSKANNLNNVLKEIRKFEQQSNWNFAALTVHDSEDIVHPYELKLTNFLLDRHDALQMPVFPLQDTPTLKNFFKDMVRLTYADEFAQNHYQTLVLRDVLNAVVPSAGTGFVLSKKILDTFSDDEIFSDGSLTEDYKLSLTLAENGFHIHYALASVKRINKNGDEVDDYIATRSMFPSTFKTAIKQKTRWVYGISMQSANTYDIIFKDHEGSIVERLSVLKDIKVKISNLLSLPAYLCFIYFILHLIFDIPEMYPYQSLSFYLCIVLTLMAIERQIVRGYSLYKIYGWAYVVTGILTPPFIPIRIIVGNIINFCATFNSWKRYFLRNKKTKHAQKKPKLKWDKTEHEFPNKHDLIDFQRDILDILIIQNYLDLDLAKKILEESIATSVDVAQILLDGYYISEHQLLKAIAFVNNKIYIRNLRKIIYEDLRHEFDLNFLKDNIVLPLRKLDDGYLYAICLESVNKVGKILKHETNQNTYYVFATKDEILSTLEKEKLETDTYSYFHELFIAGQISWEQELLADLYQSRKDNILEYMGYSS
ncbi:phage adsorption protein NrfB [Erysipelotrichaceae bacterium OttesenSCG-928-M19]|nr:phage adsorption protein NrfB [Erysipelotrichaceae bacterium OttesenSCG-928-M19]